MVCQFRGRPPADAYGLKAQIHLILEDLPKSEQAIRRRFPWLSAEKELDRILLSILLQQERYKDARPCWKMRLSVGRAKNLLAAIDCYLL